MYNPLTALFGSW